MLVKNEGNVTSANNYILNEPEFKDLKDILTKHINDYISNIYKPKYKATGYITQSWLNYTKKGEFHHIHQHPNSFVSGVLYINAIKDKDKILITGKSGSGKTTLLNIISGILLPDSGDYFINLDRDVKATVVNNYVKTFWEKKSYK